MKRWCRWWRSLWRSLVAGSGAGKQPGTGAYRVMILERSDEKTPFELGVCGRKSGYMSR